MGSFAKRLGFHRTDTAHALSPTATSPDSLSNSEKSTGNEKASATGRQIPEAVTLEAQKKLKDLERKHRWDPNLPSDTLEELDEATHAHDFQHDINLVGAFEENSPYPEVRAAVRNVSCLISV